MRNKLVTKDGEVLGELHINNLDFPWFLGEFVAYKKFDNVKNLFEKSVSLTEMINNIEDRIDQGEGIESELFKLEDEKEKIDDLIDELELSTHDILTDEKSEVLSIIINQSRFEYR